MKKIRVKKDKTKSKKMYLEVGGKTIVHILF
jgi:hypothetical protein